MPIRFCMWLLLMLLLPGRALEQPPFCWFCWCRLTTWPTNSAVPTAVGALNTAGASGGDAALADTSYDAATPASTSPRKRSTATSAAVPLGLPPPQPLLPSPQPTSES